MELGFLVRGFIFGFSIALPPGAIGVLCIRRTLAEGRLTGLVCGMGAATADAFYGIVAAFGITLISSFLIGQQDWIRLIGGGFLVYLGVKTFFTPPADKPAEIKGKGLLGAYLSTLFLTLTNPATILSYVAIFASLGIGNGAGDYLAASLLVLGVFSGSATWWLILSNGVGMFRHRISPEGMKWANRLSGTVITVIGLIALVSLIRR